MTAEISILIPTLNSEKDLTRCLTGLMEGLHRGILRELIVTDGGSTDATLAIADDAGAVIVRGPASRGGQLRRGAAVARGRWLLVLHADTVPEPGWSEAVAAHLVEGNSAPAYFQLAFRARGAMPAWVAGWANLRARIFALPYGDQGLLVPVAAYHAAGGYPDQPLMEDVALVRALGRPMIGLPVRAHTSAARYVKAGWLRRGTRNLLTLARYFAGTDPARLSKTYNG
ncbi:MAG: TIGR04283 family arsenosugar biosynthesis glycosyltransferase [Rhodobacteraceae bacterium]|nr:TIGR04283 family arsenosugar biosynthesis glycosyltransferase [Paracoccaceae bacterium]